MAGHPYDDVDDDAMKEWKREHTGRTNTNELRSFRQSALQKLICIKRGFLAAIVALGEVADAGEIRHLCVILSE